MGVGGCAFFYKWKWDGIVLIVITFCLGYTMWSECNHIFFDNAWTESAIANMDASLDYQYMLSYCSTLSCFCFSCSESIAVLANIRRHLGFMGSSIGYISDRVNEDKLIVLDSPVSSEGFRF